MAQSTDPADNAGNGEPAGLECRRCGCRHFYVLYTRRRSQRIERRRQCRHCGTRVTTWEKAIS